jgi:uncharacterized radical SAM superfamily Fe-S cluster-containing enzyme
METISIKDFAAFIESQPDERKINMHEFDPKFFPGRNICGCVMVHYGREILKIKEDFACGNTDFYIVYGDEAKIIAKLPFGIVSIVGSATNYQQAKERLRNLKESNPGLFA